MAILHRAPAQLSSNLERQLSDLPKDSFGSSGACRRRLGKVRYVTYSRRRRGSASRPEVLRQVFFEDL
jgi:hypothetical protein